MSAATKCFVLGASGLPLRLRWGYATASRLPFWQAPFFSGGPFLPGGSRGPDGACRQLVLLEKKGGARSEPHNRCANIEDRGEDCCVQDLSAGRLGSGVGRRESKARLRATLRLAPALWSRQTIPAPRRIFGPFGARIRAGRSAGNGATRGVISDPCARGASRDGRVGR